MRFETAKIKLWPVKKMLHNNHAFGDIWGADEYMIDVRCMELKDSNQLRISYNCYGQNINFRHAYIVDFVFFSDIACSIRKPYIKLQLKL